MGVLLLQGWAMMEACCEECNVPLMRSRDKKQEVCVQCNKDYKAVQAQKEKLDEKKKQEEDKKKIQE